MSATNEEVLAISKYVMERVIGITTDAMTEAASQIRDQGGIYTAGSVADLLTSVAADTRTAFNAEFGGGL